MAGRRIAFVPLGLLLIASGCKVAPPRPPLVETVAILLFDNASNDINAPDIMRKLVYQAMRNSNYKILDPDFVKGKLEAAGIVDGGQLPVIDPAKLGKDLGVHALMYGSVESFNYTNIGFYLQRKVTLELKLVDVATGSTLWENSGTGAKRELNLDVDKAQKALVRGLAEQLAEKALKTPLEEEARMSVAKALSTLPGFYFTGFYQDKNDQDAAPRPA